MVYSNTEYYLDTPPELLPPPPMFMTLVSGYKETEEKGAVRHHEDLEKVKKYLSWVYRGTTEYGPWDHTTRQHAYVNKIPGGVARIPWKLFEWKGDHYELLFEAKKGDKREDCPLMARAKRVPKKAKPAEEHEVQKAIASIMAAVAS